MERIPHSPIMQSMPTEAKGRRRATDRESTPPATTESDKLKSFEQEHHSSLATRVAFGHVWSTCETKFICSNYSVIHIYSSTGHTVPKGFDKDFYAKHGTLTIRRKRPRAAERVVTGTKRRRDDVGGLEPNKTTTGCTCGWKQVVGTCSG